MTAGVACVDRTPTYHDRQAADLLCRAIAEVRGPGRVSEGKVFVAALWREMCRLDAPAGAPLTEGCTLRDFQRWLCSSRLLTIDGTEAGAPLFVLALADVVSAMDAALLGASEFVAMGVTYHFALDPAVHALRPAPRMPALPVVVGRVGARRPARKGPPA